MDFGSALVGNIIAFSAIAGSAMAVGHRMIKSSVKQEFDKIFVSREDVDDKMKMLANELKSHSDLDAQKFTTINDTLLRLEGGISYITRRLDEFILHQATGKKSSSQ
jgi:hypothetical protein